MCVENIRHWTTTFSRVGNVEFVSSTTMSNEHGFKYVCSYNSYNILRRGYLFTGYQINLIQRNDRSKKNKIKIRKPREKMSNSLIPTILRVQKIHHELLRNYIIIFITYSLSVFFCFIHCYFSCTQRKHRRCYRTEKPRSSKWLQIIVCTVIKNTT